MGLISEKGSIEIEIPNKVFQPGENIVGKVTLKLDKPTKARALKIAFYGVGSAEPSIILNDFLVSKTLSGKKVYNNNETLEFELQIPGRLLAFPPYDYYMKAYLDLPFKIDILKIIKIQINLEKADRSLEQPSNITAVVGLGIVCILVFLFGGMLAQILIVGLLVALPFIFILSKYLLKRK